MADLAFQTSPLAQASKRWNTRFAQARAAGLDIEKLRPIAKYDLNRVMRGAQPMADPQANIAMVAGGLGKQIIHDPETKRTTPRGILGNVPKDIGKIIWGFIPGTIDAVANAPAIAKEAANLAKHGGPFVQSLVSAAPGNPLHLASLTGSGNEGANKRYLQQHGYEPKGAEFSPAGLAASLRNMAEGPEGSKNISAYALIPGLSTAARLTTGAGREDIRQHPVGTALDVLPVASAAGRGAAAGKLAVPGSATEALQAGRPVKALARTIPASREARVIDVATGQPRRANLAERTREMIRYTGLDNEIAEKLARPYSIRTRRLHADVRTFFETAIRPVIEKFTPEQRVQLFQEAENLYVNPRTGQASRWTYDVDQTGTVKPKLVDIAPEHQAALMWAKRIKDQFEDLAESRGSLVRVPGPDGRAHVYPTSSKVNKQYQEISGLVDRYAEAKAKPSTPQREAHMKRLQRKIQSKQTKLDELMVSEHLPAAWQPAVMSRLKAGVEGSIRTSFQGEQLAGALKEMNQSVSWQDFRNIVGPEEFGRLAKDAMSSWVEMSKMGMDPIWMKHVPETRFKRILYPRPIPDEFISPSQWRDRVFNFSPHVQDLAVGLTAAGVDILRSDATRLFGTEVVQPLTRTAGDVKADLRAIYNARGYTDEQVVSAVERDIEKGFARWDPENPFSRDTPRTTSDADLLLPMHVHRAIKGLMGYQNRLPVKGLWDKSLNTFKFAVLTGPRHLVHVGVGGLMFAILREPGTLLQLRNAFKIVKGDSSLTDVLFRGKTGKMPLELPHSLYDIELPTDGLFGLARGKTMARHFTEVVGDKFKAYAKFEEFVSNVERTASYLSAAKRGLDHEAALQVAHKTFVDLDALTPNERYIVKQAFPFYAFTKHLFKYLLTYPVDHPIRASILSKFARQEIEEWKTGLPEKYQHMFFLGSGDEVTAVDFKSINPFRSFSDQFTLTGFVQALNPAAATVLQTMGVNPVAAVPELYPETEYNPETGSIQAKRKGLLSSALHAYIPVSQAFEAVAGQSDRLRELRRTDPTAYRRALFNFLNLPFPYGKISKSAERAEVAVKKYNEAGKAVGRGMTDGNWNEAMQYNLVPFRGQLVPPETVKELWQQLEEVTGEGLNPKAILPPYRGRR